MKRTKSTDNIENLEEFRARYIAEMKRRSRLEIQEKALLGIVMDGEAHKHTSRFPIESKDDKIVFGSYTFYKLDTDLTPEEFAMKVSQKKSEYKRMLKELEENKKRKQIPQMEILNGYQ